MEGSQCVLPNCNRAGLTLPVAEYTHADGTIILTFTGCNSGTVEYDIPSIGRSGVVPIQRIVGDNIEQCENSGSY